MNPRLRVLLATIAGAALAATLAWNVANESYGLAGLCAVVVLWLAAEWIRGPLPDAWMLAALLFGYVIGNRGFAQWILTPWFPLLPAEAGLLVCAPVLVLRMARKEVTGIRRDGLNFAILLWMIIGIARLPLDWRAHGFAALRDFATVYYAAFFFLAQAVARHAASARLLRNALLAAGVALPVTYLMFSRLPEFFLTTLEVRGAPLFFYKDDLVAAYLFAGFFLFQTVTAWGPSLRGLVAAISYATVFTINSSRAAIVGLVVTSVWWALARRWAPWKLQGLIVPVGLCVLALLALFRDADFRQSRLYEIYEHVTSIVDVTGTRGYAHAEREFVGDNNRFRMIWWRSVIEETWEGNPVFGLGFGHDLAERFIRRYNVAMSEEFSARSPHSILFTVFGRMGLVGLAVFLALVAAMVARTWRMIRRAHQGDTALTVLGWWSVAWVMFTSACFGVVLEGPMGAVIFWIALGAANQGTHELEEKQRSLEAAEPERAEEAISV